MKKKTKTERVLKMLRSSRLILFGFHCFYDVSVLKSCIIIPRLKGQMILCFVSVIYHDCRTVKSWVVISLLS
jgi:hypothetical protein